MLKYISRKIERLFYRLQWHFHFLSRGPIHADIELTTRCKLKCKMCYRHKWPTDDADIDYGDAIYTMTEAWHAGVKSVKLNWRGEPILHKSILAFASWARKLGFVDVMLNTRMNEPLKGRGRAFMLLFDTLKVSLDTMKGARKTVINNLLELQKYGCVIIQRTVYDGLESDKQFVYSLRQAGIRRFKLISRPARNRGAGGIDGGIRKYCGQPSRRLIVDSGLDVWACCCAYTQDAGLYLGNLLESSMVEIWNSNKRRQLEKNLRARRYDVTDTCLHCPCSDGWRS